MSTQPPEGNDPYGTGTGRSDPYAGGTYGPRPPGPSSGAGSYGTDPLQPVGAGRTGDLDVPLRGAGFGAAVGRYFKKYANFKGRASRSEYWWVALFTSLVSVVAHYVPIVGLLELALIVPNLSLGARRLHDIGRSGWWQLLALIPIVGWIVLLVFWCRSPSPEGDRFGPDGISA